MTEKISTHLLLVEQITINLVGCEDAIKDIFVFLCLWPPVILEECDNLVVLWGMKEHVLVWEEDNGVFIFQFKEEESKNYALHGGPWFYNISMLLLSDYDGIGDLSTVPRQFFEVWQAVRCRGRSAVFFMMLESHLVQRTFAFSLEVAVELELRYENVRAYVVTVISLIMTEPLKVLGVRRKTDGVNMEEGKPLKPSFALVLTRNDEGLFLNFLIWVSFTFFCSSFFWVWKLGIEALSQWFGVGDVMVLGLLSLV
ncbi:hypothetical protein ACLB2K_067009 [Fragaria x ananassa]